MSLYSASDLDEIRSRYRVSDIAARHVKLRKRGGEYVGLCPFHMEKTPSFTINDAKGFYHCFGCGAHGDIFRFVMETHGLNFRAAVEAIDSAKLPTVSPTDHAQMLADDEARESSNRADARRFWEEGRPLLGTPADAYLCWRQIFIRPEELRFGRIPSRRDDNGLWHRIRLALMLRAESLSGDFMGIQRIYLTDDGGKANMPNPKLSLGDIRGASIRFGRPASDVILTGSPEDGLTLHQRFGKTTVYVSCGESMLHLVRLPKLCRTVTIARQNDKPGRQAAKRTEAAMREQGRAFRHIAPKPAFKDWNDEVRYIPQGIAA